MMKLTSTLHYGMSSHFMHTLALLVCLFSDNDDDIVLFKRNSDGWALILTRRCRRRVAVRVVRPGGGVVVAVKERKQR